MQGGQRPTPAGPSIDEIFAKTTAKLVRKRPVRPGSASAAAAAAAAADAEKKKKKKKKFRELDYDPDSDTTIPAQREEWEDEGEE
jgi:hypothetical protein